MPAEEAKRQTKKTLTIMKYIIPLLCFFLLASCKQERAGGTREELTKLKAELEAKKQELSDKQAIADVEKELEEVNRQIKQVEKGDKVEVENIPLPQSPLGVVPVAVTTNEEAGKAQITGSNVTMRKDASVQSEKLGSFDANEKVDVLETKNVNNDREAILSKPLTVKGQGGEANLPKGKAVMIEEYQSERNMYLVTYQDPQKGKLTAEIDASAVETITYSTWYKVKRSNGETGWVLGKFLKTGQN